VSEPILHPAAGRETDRRREDESAARRRFAQQKALLKDAILHDLRLTPSARLIGYEIADYLNFKTGNAWPSRERLAERTFFSVKTVQRETRILADDHGGWFQREIDGDSYCYTPRFDRLKTSAAVDEGGRSRPEGGDMSGVANVPQSSLENPFTKENPGGFSRLPFIASPTARPEKTDDRRKVIALGDQDELITKAAAAGGCPRFVYQDSIPWRFWNEYRQSQGLPPLPTRQHMVDGVLRTGWDVPTVYPPALRACTKQEGRGDDVAHP